jgi:hypothetical protein
MRKLLFTLTLISLFETSFGQLSGKQHVFQYDSLKTDVVATIEVGALVGVPVLQDRIDIRTIYPAQRLYMAEIRFILEKMMTRRFSVGGGLSFDISDKDVVMSQKGMPSLIMPGYLNLKYCFLKKRITPFIAGQIGAALYVTKQEGHWGGGAMTGIQIGAKCYASQKVAVNFSLGYRFQHIAYIKELLFTDDQGNNTILVKQTFNTYIQFISLGVGVTF